MEILVQFLRTAKICRKSLNLLIRCTVRCVYMLNLICDWALVCFCCDAMLCISTAYAIVRCPPVCHVTCKIVSEMAYNVSSGTLNPTVPMLLYPSITFMYSVEMSKHILKTVSPLGNHIILVFPYQTLCNWGKNRSSTNIWLLDLWLL